ncbi:methionyl-tRNA formyltransferase [candidate division WWE3 bacterium]|nr:methionyl-tRNA formyltransferase [candidate division WWE3 bacterium]
MNFIKNTVTINLPTLSKPVNIVYFGTSNYSTILLNSLKTSPMVNIKLAITKEDKPVGRKKEITPSAVKSWCLNNAVPFLTARSLKKDVASVLAKLKTMDYSKRFLGLVADFGMIIPNELIEYFDKGIVNVHFSKLPKYRGAAPVAYTLLNGDETAGITFLLTSGAMDKGDILKQIPFEIKERETSESLYKKLFELASNYAPGVLSDYAEGLIKPVKQNEEEATYTTPSGKFDRTTFLLKEDARINFAWDYRRIERAIRAFYPWPIAWTTLNELANALNSKSRNPKLNPRVKIFESRLEGRLLTFDRLQVEGGKIISFSDFANGFLVSLTAPSRSS